MLTNVNVITSCFLLISVRKTFGECYVSPGGDYCSSLDDLRTRNSTVEIVQVIGDDARATLDASYFKELHNLKKLKISKSVNRITLDSFNGLQSLKSLSLEDNYFYEVRNEFFKNIPITELSLVANAISYIRKRSFSNLPNLTTLDLSRNKLTTIHYGVFNDLKIKDLVLNQNNIAFIQMGSLNGLVDLIKLDLSQNEVVKFVSTELADSRIYNLLEIDLSQNKITTLDVSRFTKLRSLNLMLNKIKRFGRGTFVDNVDLIEVNFAANEIEELQPDLVPLEGAQIRTLDVTLNRLSYIDQEFLARLPKLAYMHLCGNPWQCPCYNVIDEWFKQNPIINTCDIRFKQGALPICIFTENADTDCKYGVNLYEDYKSHINASDIKLNYKNPYSYIKFISSV